MAVCCCGDLLQPLGEGLRCIGANTGKSNAWAGCVGDFDVVPQVMVHGSVAKAAIDGAVHVAPGRGGMWHVSGEEGVVSDTMFYHSSVADYRMSEAVIEGAHSALVAARWLGFEVGLCSGGRMRGPSSAV